MLFSKRSLSAILAAGLRLGQAGTAGNAIDITARATVPNGASKVVDHSYASFSFPAHFFADFAGNSSLPNLFSRDILELLSHKTGVMPYIRVGGTSADHTYYNESQAASVIESGFNANGIPSKVEIGPAWFEGLNNFPGSKWVFQVNMWNTTDNALREARKVMEVCRDSLLAFEIGNEPDIAAMVGEAKNFTLEQYVQRWRSLATDISSEVLRGNPYGLNDRYLFEALTLADHNANNFSVEGAFEDCIDCDGYVKLVSQHQYASGSQWWVNLQGSFMNHTAIADNLTQYQGDIQYLKQNYPNVTYVLGETNSDFVNTNMWAIEGVFGSALWLVDYLMFGMTQNITRMHLIQGTNFGYTAWVPVESGGRAPYTRPPLYGFLFHADVIGTAPEIRVEEVALGLWNFSAYAVYDAGRLAKFVLVNLDEWNSTTPYARPQQTVSIAAPSSNGGGRGECGCPGEHGKRGKDGSSCSGMTAKVQRLTAGGASADAGITWGGLSWNYTDSRLVQQGCPVAEELVFDAQGRAELTVASSEAVLITF